MGDHRVKVSSNARTVLEKRYLKKVDGKVTEAPEDMLRRVARNIAGSEALYGGSQERVEELAEQFYRLMDNLEFMPNSPTLMNAGRDLQQLSACFVLPIEDSMESIFESVKNMAVIQKSGGGTGFSFSRLRPKNDQVRSTGGVASGPISFLKVFNASTDAIKQGGTRRGANMGILRYDHPDIMEFITCKERNTDITNFNISVGITEEFMKKVEEDEEYDLVSPRDGEVVGSLRAREVFQKIIDGAWRNGEPGIVFLDRLNRDNPTPHLGEIESTNPCVTGDTLVSTDRGLVKARDLQTGMRIHTPIGPRPITHVINNGVKEVLALSTARGLQLKLTSDHNLRCPGRGWVAASELKVGDLVEILAGTITSTSSAFPVGLDIIGLREKSGYALPLELTEDYGFLLGLVSLSDGSSPGVFLFGDQQQSLRDRVEEVLKGWGVPVERRRVGRTMVLVTPARLKRVWKALGVGCQGVPRVILSASRRVQQVFAETVFQYGAWVDLKGNLHLAGSPQFLQELQVMMISLGIEARIGGLLSEGRMAEDGLSVMETGSELLVPEGSLEGTPSARIWSDRVVSIVPSGAEEVFDVTEPETLTWITNGFISLDCGEQPLLPYESCFAPETKVLTDKGWEAIEVLYQRQDAGQAVNVYTDEIVQGNKGLELRPATVVRVGERDVVRLEMQNGLCLRATPDHKVLTERGWVPIEDLTMVDEVVTMHPLTMGDAREETPEVKRGEIATASPGEKIAFLKGLFGKMGSVSRYRGLITLSMSTPEAAQEVQLILLEMGVGASIVRQGSDRPVVQITLEGMTRFMETVGFPDAERKSVAETWIEQARRKRVSKNRSRVRSIAPDGRVTVYDISEPVTHSLIAQGIVAHNCNLGSINLAKMVTGVGSEPAVDYHRLGEVVSLAVRFLDDVIDANRYPLAVIEERTKGNRKIGLGVMGFADMLLMLGIPYDSEEALKLAEDIMGFIMEKGVNASRKLAEERGPFPNFLGSTFEQAAEPPIRNATTTTVAPTGTISIISGCSSGVEPLFAIAFTRRVLDGEELTEVHPLFEEMARERGFYSPEVMRLVAASGSVQDIPDVPEDVRRLFVTALDIEPEWHVRMQAAFQKYTHNAVSKTINLRESATVEDVGRIYRLAYEMGCKGLTVFRMGSREEQVLSVGDTQRERNEIEPRPRPQVTVGRTERIKTGCGNLYVTVNEDELGLCEVFASMGKSGGCAASQSEAVARLISIALRSGVKVEAIIKELRGIRCPSPSWQNGGMVLSCADAIGIVLSDYLRNGDDKEEYPHKLFAAGADELQHHMGACPECGGHVRHEAGCVVCVFCGYSKC